MRILFVGDLNSHARSYQRCRAFGDLGHDVCALSTRSIPTLPGITAKASLCTRIRWRLGYPPDKVNVNAQIVKVAREREFDLLWIEKGLMIRPSTLDKVRDANPRTILSFCSEDDMYARHNQSAYFRRCLPKYDFVFTTKSYNVQELPQIGARCVVFVGKAYDRATHRPVSVDEKDQQRLGAEVIFVGSYEEDRANYMLSLAENGLPVRVWGNGWQNWQGRHPNLIIEGQPVYGEDYVRALCASKIGLCFLSKINRDLQTDRTMEIPACGTFMLAERTREHLSLFEEGREAEFFGSQEELCVKVRYYLAHEDKRQQIAAAGRKRCVTSGYSHHDRLAYMLGCIERGHDAEPKRA